jgi:GTP-binding protein
MKKPIVAIVGRQNAGKSTLLNRIAGKRLAIVEDLPGTTRDRLFADVAWQGTQFTIVDTGGLQPEPQSIIDQSVKEQIETSIEEADVILCLVDVKDGVIPSDLQIADWLRRTNKPVLLVANKVDNARFENMVFEFYQLGLGDPIPISAHHGHGVADLLDKIIPLLPAGIPEEPESEVIKVAILGRPNVGKSMMLNALTGQKRVIVDNVPGTTRDAIDTPFVFQDQKMLLIDTAGIRRRGRVERGIEQYSVIRTLKAIERADIVLLLLDATELVTAQDTHITGYIQQSSKGIILIVNKWDLVENKDIDQWTKHIRNKIRFAVYAPILYTSAMFGQGINKIMPQVLKIYNERLKRLPDERVNDVIQQAVTEHSLSGKQHRLLKFYQTKQTAVNPPTFTFLTNNAKLVHFSYQRYLENKLRQAFGFDGTPLSLIFKTKGRS